MNEKKDSNQGENDESELKEDFSEDTSSDVSVTEQLKLFENLMNNDYNLINVDEEAEDNVKKDDNSENNIQVESKLNSFISSDNSVNFKIKQEYLKDESCFFNYYSILNDESKVLKDHNKFNYQFQTNPKMIYNFSNNLQESTQNATNKIISTSSVPINNKLEYSNFQNKFYSDQNLHSLDIRTPLSVTNSSKFKNSSNLGFNTNNLNFNQVQNSNQNYYSNQNSINLNNLNNPNQIYLQSNFNSKNSINSHHTNQVQDYKTYINNNLNNLNYLNTNFTNFQQVNHNNSNNLFFNNNNNNINANTINSNYLLQFNIETPQNKFHSTNNTYYSRQNQIPTDYNKVNRQSHVVLTNMNINYIQNSLYYINNLIKICNLTDFICTHKGSKEFQAQIITYNLEISNVLIKNFIASKGIEKLMVNFYGNYIFQKVIEFCSSEYRIYVISNIVYLEEISENICGSHSLQGIVVSCKTTKEMHYIQMKLSDYACTFALKKNSLHIVIKLITQFPYEARENFSYKLALNSQILVNHQHGVCAVSFLF